jgi:hypothetical protein
VTSSRPPETIPVEPDSVTEAAPPLRFTERYVLGILGTFAAMVFGMAARRRLQEPPSGDEPHYLVLNEALRRYHTVDPTLAYAHGDYRSFYPGLLQAHTSVAANGATVPLHNVGGPLLWHPFYLLGGRSAVAAFLVAVSVLAVLNLYWLLRDLGIGRPYAVGVSALFVVGSPLYVYSSMVFVESIGTLVVLYAARQVLAPERSPVRLMLASAGLGYLPLVHGRFVVFTLAGGVLLAARVATRVRRRSPWPYLRALGPLVVIFGAVTGFNLVAYGTVNPAPGNANMGAGLLAIPVYRGLLSLLFDRYYGLLPYFPLLAFAFPGVLLSLRRGSAWVHLTLLGFTVPYLLAISTFNFWWGGFSPPARFLAVVAPLLGYYVAVTLQRLHSVIASALALLAGLVSFLISVAGDILLADRFDSGAHSPMLLIDRISHLFGVSRFSHALPSILVPAGGNVAKFAAWTGVLAVFTVVVWLAGRRGPADRVPVPTSRPSPRGRVPLQSPGRPAPH